MKRDAGYYWVKRQIIWVGPPVKSEIVWEVMLWEYGQWRTAGSIVYYSDAHFLEIDENRLIKIKEATPTP